MAFLAPAFLAGLLALAVPVFIHLTHRERREAVAFPSLMFLRKIPFKSVRKQRLRHLLLLAMRCLALLLLVLAFARPLFGRRSNAAGAAARGAREVVILLDQSYSMGYGNRWARAVDAARGAVEGLAPGDRATIVAFDSRADIVASATADRAVLRAAIDEVKPGSGTTRYGPAVRTAAGILEESSLPRRHVVLITDFQRNGWNPQEEIRLPRGTVVEHLDLSDERVSNALVTGVELDSDDTGARERIAVAARVANTGADSVGAREVVLEVDGRKVDAKRVSVAPRSAAVVAFAPVAVPASGAAATVRLAGDALPVDDAFHFLLERPQAVQVLIISPAGGSAGRGAYIRRALEIGNQPRFAVTRTTLDRVTAASLEGRSLVILDDAGTPSAELARRLAAFVQGGGGLIVATGERGATATWPAALRDLLPATAGPIVDRTATRGGAMATLDRTHPALQLFSAPRSGDFTSARVFRYRGAEPRADATILARFDDGAPALLERTDGKGRVMLWTSTFDGLWNDLPVQPVFLPFVHEIAKHSAGYAEERPWATVGRVVELSRQAAAVLGPASPQANGEAEAREIVVVAPSGARTTIAPLDGAYVNELREQGFHEIRALDGRTARARPIAVNLDIAESELVAADAEELIASLRSTDSTDTSGTAAGDAELLSSEERERRQGTWWYLLAAAALLLVAETAMSNRLSRGRISAPAVRSNS